MESRAALLFGFSQTVTDICLDSSSGPIFVARLLGAASAHPAMSAKNPRAVKAKGRQAGRWNRRCCISISSVIELFGSAGPVAKKNPREALRPDPERRTVKLRGGRIVLLIHNKVKKQV